jgi:hypothetical protein
VSTRVERAGWSSFRRRAVGLGAAILALAIPGAALADVTPPTVSHTDPASPSNDSSPTVFGSADPGTTVRLYSGPNCDGAILSSGSAEEFSTTGITIPDIARDWTTFIFANATDASGAVSACSTTFVAYTQDSTAPETTITDGPPAVSDSKNATFRFNASEEVSGFECQVDAGAFEPCGSPERLNGLRRGDHTFAVRAIDLAGNVDDSPATVSWTVIKKHGSAAAGRRGHRHRYHHRGWR